MYRRTWRKEKGENPVKYVESVQKMKPVTMRALSASCVNGSTVIAKHTCMMTHRKP